ncbi:MAG TPA: response regulator [Candidatus Nanoarchaeia archaeon]|nr:response regulator [Candidatus Nanoarchaeia archaeon]
MRVDSLLYVEDDERLRETMQRQFARAICSDVETAENSGPALEMARRKRYDLIIMDGLEGACFALYEGLKDIPHGDVVIFSGDDRYRGMAESLGIPFYKKFEDLSKLTNTYRD